MDIRANKPQIKNAVEKAFDVKVTTVNVMIMKGKPRGRRRSGGAATYGSDWKKAVVTLMRRTTRSSCSRACNGPREYEEKAGGLRDCHALRPYSLQG